MNEEKLRVAILKALGWTQTDFGSWITPGGDPAFDSGLFDPLASRDAAIEAVIELCGSGILKMKFIHRLRDELETFTRNISPSSELFEIMTAKPLQICTALAKGLNLPIEEHGK